MPGPARSPTQPPQAPKPAPALAERVCRSLNAHGPERATRASPAPDGTRPMSARTTTDSANIQSNRSGSGHQVAGFSTSSDEPSFNCCGFASKFRTRQAQARQAARCQWRQRTINNARIGRTGAFHHTIGDFNDRTKHGRGPIVATAVDEHHQSNRQHEKACTTPEHRHTPNCQPETSRR